MFTPTAYYISVCIASFLITWLYPVCLGFLTFFFLDLKQHTFWDSIQFTFILWLIGMTGSYTGITFGCYYDKHNQAFRYLQIVIIAFNMSAGFFANTG